MKHRSIFPCFGILIVSLACCAEQSSPDVNECSGKSETKVATRPPVESKTTAGAETSEAPARTPLPRNVRKDADGNLINRDGWSIQKIIPQETRRRTETGKTRTGRKVIFNVFSFTPQGRAVSEVVAPDESYYEWRIRHVRELSGRDGKIFCHEYSASLFARNGNDNSGMTTATSYRPCDYDEDGKYEYNGSGYKFTIPEWVKTLPGDPSAVNNYVNN